MPVKKEERKDFIKFLGTAGARFVMIRQLRASGGLWVSYKGTNVLVDPGPGSIVRCAASKPKLDPFRLDGIILTHRHLDHSGDINVMIEAMTEGGFKKKGIVFCPADTLDQDQVILKYEISSLEKLEILEANKDYKVGNLEFQTSPRHIHSVETYGLKFKMKNKVISYLVDTRYAGELVDFYKGTDILIICVVFFEPRGGIDHLSLQDVETLIEEIRPGKVILTHFGMTMLKAKPHIQAENLSRRLNIEVVSAYDGMTVDCS
ncbi:MAG: MBL fold metallo-hydrolase [Candidatus Omnitrophica bacterium]|nr:MBL fold metallo-hydrolase [Candidatus Omnitrophota bacterium]MBU4472687.1 MBL fold metallo-hydrolase [Candidatus Omnitrophota bacterium]MCG2705968.1 MBL fold metallo-hydrolase [Candidatus Omnitrophota bacterium]